MQTPNPRSGRDGDRFALSHKHLSRGNGSHGQGSSPEGHTNLMTASRRLMVPSAVVRKPANTKTLGGESGRQPTPLGFCPGLYSGSLSLDFSTCLSYLSLVSSLVQGLIAVSGTRPWRWGRALTVPVENGEVIQPEGYAKKNFSAITGSGTTREPVHNEKS